MRAEIVRTAFGIAPLGAARPLATAAAGVPAEEAPDRRASRGARAALVMAIAVILAIAALLARVGADAQWLAALGHVVVSRHAVPEGVPFASAASAHWPNVLVLAEVAFNGLEQGLGDRGLILAQLLALGVALAVLARDAIDDGAPADATAAALLLAAVGALPSLVIVRAQLFSLALFPVLVALLRSDARRPSARIWLVVAVLTLWGNLHGAALVGLLVTFGYLLLGRFHHDRRTAVAVAVAAVLGLCLTPALAGTITYYHGVLTNVAAQRGVGLWAPLSLAAPFDDVAILAAAVLAWRALRSRPRLWEVAVIVGLAVLSVDAGRSAVWLLFFLIAPAARSIHVQRKWGRLPIPITIVALATVGFAIARGPTSAPGEHALVSRAVVIANGTPVLATDRLAEQVALDGGRIWLGNPLDAFSAHEQTVYLDWLEGGRNGTAALVPAVHVVLVGRGTATDRLMARAPKFVPVAGDSGTVLYRRLR